VLDGLLGGAALDGAAKVLVRTLEWAKVHRRGAVLAALAGAPATITGDDAEASPLSRAASAALRALRDGDEQPIRRTIENAAPKLAPGKVETIAKREAALRDALRGAAEDDVLWSGSLGEVRVGHQEFVAHHIMLEHPGDLDRILRAAGVPPDETHALGRDPVTRLERALDELAARGEQVSEQPERYALGELRVRVVRKSRTEIGTLYVEPR